MGARRLIFLIVMGLLASLVILVAVLHSDAGDDEAIVPTAEPAGSATPEPSAEEAESTPTPTPEPRPVVVPPVDLASVGQPWEGETDGVLTFRGNPTRTFTGSGPVPEAPVVRWAYGGGGTLCESTAPQGITEPRCGTTWPGQPIVVDDGSGPVVVFGAFDGSVRVVNAASGLDQLPPFLTGGPVTGTVTADPDGFPLLYVGSQDGSFRVLATDRSEITELWHLDATSVEPPGRSDDWDSAAITVGDLLVMGGENGHLHVVQLGRDTDADGLVTVNPGVVFSTPTWDDELLAEIGGPEGVAVESSVAVSGQTVWVANSAGLIQGWDLAPLEAGEAPVQVFRFWLGDDADATIVVDENGHLYVGQLFAARTDQARSLGHVARLDPTKPNNPVVWSARLGSGEFSGVQATPALHRDVLYTATNDGRLVGMDRATGNVRWEKQLVGPTWGSPIVVDDVLIQVDCSGFVRGYDVSDTAVEPPLAWSLELGGCLESTPVVWDGAVYVGSRDGRVFALADN